MWRGLLLILLVVTLGDGTHRAESLYDHVLLLARDHLFDYVSWEIDALWFKARQEILGTQIYLDDTTRQQQVLDYFDIQTQVTQLEAEIARLYADPAITDPATASAGLRDRLGRLRDQLADDQRLVEGILEEQVSAVLLDEGFGTLGQILPPVSMHFSELPMVLLVSPRDRIELVVSTQLTPLSLEQRGALEARIDSDLGVSSLVEPLGGLSLFPAMIEETPTLARAIEVTAHEWVHTYLIWFPLGMEYSALPETQIINETVATFFGREIALKTLARYYPTIAPPDYPSFFDPPPDISAIEPPPFDFYATLNETRITVDALLAEGKIDEAEAYMEQQRRLFVAQGYAIRKLNQAYFAFHGGYQGQPGAGGTDPTGPSVEELLQLSPDLHRFIKTLRGVTTRADLLVALDGARAG